MYYADEDADVDVAVIACTESMSNNVTVVGEDTDLLILLLYYSTLYDSAYNLTFRSDLRKTKYPNGHDILLYRDALGPDKCKQLLFLYAFSGCDTTSSFFNIGKPTVFNSFITSNKFQSLQLWERTILRLKKLV